MKPIVQILLDLTTIAIIQFAALGYGIHVTYSQRPVAVAMIGEFTLSATMEQVESKIESPSDLYRYSDARPPIFFADLQLDRTTLDEIIASGLWTNALEYLLRHARDPRGEFTAALRAMQPTFAQMLDALDARGLRRMARTAR